VSECLEVIITLVVPDGFTARTDNVLMLQTSAVALQRDLGEQGVEATVRAVALGRCPDDLPIPEVSGG
jgi:hypothetical protein